MNLHFEITDVHLAIPPEDSADRGLIGFVSFTLNGGLHIESLTMRQTSDGRLTLSYPSRKDQQDQRHFIVRPLNDEVRRDIERQIMDAICKEEAL